jgi:hypothetical protein
VLSSAHIRPETIVHLGIITTFLAIEVRHMQNDVKRFETTSQSAAPHCESYLQNRDKAYKKP